MEESGCRKRRKRRKRRKKILFFLRLFHKSYASYAYSLTGQASVGVRSVRAVRKDTLLRLFHKSYTSYAYFLTPLMPTTWAVIPNIHLVWSHVGNNKYTCATKLCCIGKEVCLRYAYCDPIVVYVPQAKQFTDTT